MWIKTKILFIQRFANLKIHFQRKILLLSSDLNDQIVLQFFCIFNSAAVLNGFSNIQTFGTYNFMLPILHNGVRIMLLITGSRTSLMEESTFLQESALMTTVEVGKFLYENISNNKHMLKKARNGGVDKNPLSKIRLIYSVKVSQSPYWV